MAQIAVRNIPAQHHRKLKALAARNEVSVEEQVRRLIADAVSINGHAHANVKPTRTLGDVIAELRKAFPHGRLRDGEIVELRSPIRPLDLE